MRERQPIVEYLAMHIPNLEVVWDTEGHAFHTFLAACVAAGDEPCVRLEDDVVLTKNFETKIQAVVDQVPANIVQFFSRSKYDGVKGSRWKGGGTFSMNQCYYLPAGMSTRLHRYYHDGWTRRVEDPMGYDTMMAEMLKGERYWVQVPSLVNHVVGKSAIDYRRAHTRQSTTFVDPELEGFPGELA